MAIKKLIKMLFIYFFGTLALQANTLDENNARLYLAPLLLEDAHFNFYKTELDYTILDANSYHKTIEGSRNRILQILHEIRIKAKDQPNERMLAISQRLINIPYLYSAAMGEGDWLDKSLTYKRGGLHIKQDPVYRIDGLNCQTLVQVVMGFFNSKSNNLDEFDANLIKTSYGSASNPSKTWVHYYNRNNFPDADFNPVNQRAHFLKDVTSVGALAKFAAFINVEITRKDWFAKQQQDLRNSVRVLDAAYGPWMVERFAKIYPSLDLPYYKPEKITTSYLPKEKLAIKNSEGKYESNQELFRAIPTPAVLEVVRDPKKWLIGGKPIKEVIGSDLSVSHMGILYKRHFKYGEAIYQKIACAYNEEEKKICTVQAVKCEQSYCDELMFLHATEAYPRNYYWYKNKDGQAFCTPDAPTDGTSYTMCNRVVEQPLFDYLTSYQYGAYVYMDNPSILGVHIEQLL